MAANIGDFQSVRLKSANKLGECGTRNAKRDSINEKSSLNGRKGVSRAQSQRRKEIRLTRNAQGSMEEVD